MPTTTSKTNNLLKFPLAPANPVFIPIYLNGLFPLLSIPPMPSLIPDPPINRAVQKPISEAKRKSPDSSTSCQNCRKSHVSCDRSRPCSRCVRLGLQDSCIDSVSKKRGRPKKKPEPSRNSSAEPSDDQAIKTPPLNSFVHTSTGRLTLPKGSVNLYESLKVMVDNSNALNQTKETTLEITDQSLSTGLGVAMNEFDLFDLLNLTEFNE